MPTLVLKFGDSIRNRFAFEKTVVTIGRSADNDIVVENLAVSRKHAKIEKIGNSYILTDLQSANGTFVNGERVNRRPLKHFDAVTIGKHQVVFLEDPQIQPVLQENPAPYDLDRTVVVNPGSPQLSSAPVDLVPPDDERNYAPRNIPVQKDDSVESGQFVASFMSPVFHSENCDWVQGIKPQNRVYFQTKEEAIKSGRRNCRICMPHDSIVQPSAPVNEPVAVG